MLEYVIKDIRDFSDDDLKKSYSYMCNQRKEKVKRFHNDHSKKSTLAGELLARQLMAEFLNKDAKSFKIVPDKKGKLYAENAREIFFNISHSENNVAVAICNEEIGIDIETLRPVSLKLIKKTCTGNELSYVLGDKTASDLEVIRRFFEMWTAKEAYFKCTGTGITSIKDICTLSTDFPKTKIETDNYIAHIVKISDIIPS